MNLLESFFEGMDAPDGFAYGSLALGTIGVAAFFPMFPALRSVIPPPPGWTIGVAATLTSFVCLALKAGLHHFKDSVSLSFEAAKACAGIWLLCLVYHYMTVRDPEMSLGPQDPIALLFYGALFALPTVAFTSMQIEAARRDRH